MKAELAASGLSEEEILHKAQMLMKAFGREDEGSMAQFSLASAQKNVALKHMKARVACSMCIPIAQNYPEIPFSSQPF